MLYDIYLHDNYDKILYMVNLLYYIIKILMVLLILLMLHNYSHYLMRYNILRKI